MTELSFNLIIPKFIIFLSIEDDTHLEISLPERILASDILKNLIYSFFSVDNTFSPFEKNYDRSRSFQFKVSQMTVNIFF